MPSKTKEEFVAGDIVLIIGQSIFKNLKLIGQRGVITRRNTFANDMFVVSILDDRFHDDYYIVSNDIKLIPPSTCKRKMRK